MLYRIMRRHLWGIFFLLIVALFITACSSAPAEKPPIILIANPWTSSAANAAVAEKILEDELGYTVEVIEVNEGAQWEMLASNEAQASLEVWPSGHADNVAQYIERDGTVERGGELGPVGRIAWYLPVYLLDEYPQLTSWEAFRDPAIAALFSTEATGENGRFLAGDPSWVQYDAQIIDNLGLQLEVVPTGSEEALLTEVELALQQREPVLFYFWSPHFIHAKYELTAVNLPPYSDACYAAAESGGVDCGYPPDVLFKIFSADLEEYAPEVYQFLKNFNYSDQEQIKLIGMMELEGKSAEEAAQTWVEQNDHIWRDWLP